MVDVCPLEEAFTIKYSSYSPLSKYSKLMYENSCSNKEDKIETFENVENREQECDIVINHIHSCDNCYKKHLNQRSNFSETKENMILIFLVLIIFLLIFRK